VLATCLARLIHNLIAVVFLDNDSELLSFSLTYILVFFSVSSSFRYLPLHIVLLRAENIVSLNKRTALLNINRRNKCTINPFMLVFYVATLC
jgi:hypothetical protein